MNCLGYLLILGLLAPVTITQNGINDAEVEEIKSFIDDSVIPLLKDYLTQNNIEPIALPDYQENFRFGFYKGFLNLTSGKIRGFTTLSRGGDIALTQDASNRQLRLPLLVAKLDINYVFNGKFFTYELNGQLDVQSISNNFLVVLDIDEFSLKASLREFRTLGPPGEISIKIVDKNIPNFVRNVLSSLASQHLSTLTMSVVEDTVRDVVTSAIDLYNMNI